MASRNIRFNVTIKAPRPLVYSWLGDHEKFGSLLPGRTTRIVDGTGASGINGEGSVRRVSFGISHTDEKVTAAIPDEYVEYTVVDGSPVKNHLGRIRLADAADGGTEIDYRIEFDPRIPFTGAPTEMLVRAIIGGGLAKLKRRLEAA
ncbi:SRPBCC family protein [Zavarzinia sp.]|uniref:SRPBCC family protein n=1 Tax=Zavarzinia sp. TaxID=2027920 RepID=UPI003BB6F222